MYKHYIAVWSVDEELKRGNKNSIHNFIDADGDKFTVASKLHRVSNETVKKIRELVKAESENKAGSAYDKCPICINRNKNCQFGSLDCHFKEQINTTESENKDEDTN